MSRISLFSALMGAIAVPTILNAATLSLNPSKIVKDNGIVVLAEQSAKPAPKARLNAPTGFARILRLSLCCRISA
jgi:hypothetical protein